MQVLLQGGYRDGALTSAATVLSTEQWKWFQPKLRAPQPSPAPRCGHALCAIRSRLFLFGGLTEAGLSNEVWILDLDALSWAEIPTFGAAPCARKGASLVATEDGRKLYLVGGATAAAALCDVHVLELDNFGWSALGTVGDAPQGRESPALSLTPPYLLVAGGNALGEAGGRTAISDFWVLHLQQCAPVRRGWHVSGGTPHPARVAGCPMGRSLRHPGALEGRVLTPACEGRWRCFRGFQGSRGFRSMVPDIGLEWYSVWAWTDLGPWNGWQGSGCNSRGSCMEDLASAD